VLDDASYTTAVTGVPEPSSLLLCLTGLGVMFAVWGFRTNTTPERSSSLLMSGLLFLLRFRWVSRSRFTSVRRRVLAIAPFLLAILLFASFPISAAPTLGAIFVAPTIVSINMPTSVTVSVSIPDTSLISGSVNLVRLNSGAPTILGQLHDDGLNGDALAGDRVYTIQVSLNEPAIGRVQLQVSAAFRGTLLRAVTNLPPIFVQLPNAPDVAIATLSSQLSTGNITAAIQNFSDTAKASGVLTNLSAPSLAQLAAAFNAAHLVRSSGDLRIYSAPWTPPGGQPLTLEFSLSPDSTGKWVIVSW
jgi:hypothetical protein